MRVEKLIEFEPRFIEVNICADDITAALLEAGEKGVISTVAAAHSVLIAVKDEAIELLPEGQRRIIGNALASESDRYLKKGA